MSIKGDVIFLPDLDGCEEIHLIYMTDDKIFNTKMHKLISEKAKISHPDIPIIQLEPTASINKFIEIAELNNSIAF